MSKPRPFNMVPFLKKIAKIAGQSLALAPAEKKEKMCRMFFDETLRWANTEPDFIDEQKVAEFERKQLQLEGKKPS
jgi:hypothetical protein